MTAEIVGTPNARGMQMLVDAVAKWIDEGCPCYQCQECFTPLQTAEEQKAKFCKIHMGTRKAYTLEDARRDSEKGNARRQARRAA
jgi:hypothetical protein